MSSPQHTLGSAAVPTKLRFDERGKAALLGNSFPRWKRDLLNQLSKNPQLHAYAIVLTDETEPALTQPIAPAVGASKADLTLYEVQLKRHFDAIDKRPQRDSAFSDVLINSIDHNLRSLVEDIAPKLNVDYALGCRCPVQISN